MGLQGSAGLPYISCNRSRSHPLSATGTSNRPRDRPSSALRTIDGVTDFCSQSLELRLLQSVLVNSNAFHVSPFPLIFHKSPAMTLSKRQRQPVLGKFGTLHISPLKKRDKRKTSTIVTRLGHNAKLQSLQAKMKSILAGTSAATSAGSDPVDHSPGAEWEDTDMGMEAEDLPSMGAEAEDLPSTLPVKANPRRVLPKSSDHTLFDRWKKIMPTLVDPLTAYIASTNGRELVAKKEINSACDNACCTHHTHQVLCLFLDRKWLLMLASF